MRPREVLEAFDEFLVDRALRLEAVVIGGAALNLLGVIARPTKDCDVLHPALPAAIVDAAMTFAVSVRKRGEMLADDWLNNGPSQLTDVLPSGWPERLQIAFAGRAIVLRSLGRGDLLKTKLFALCDRGIDLRDCVALAPTAGELRDATPWVEKQDGNTEWPAHVRATLDDLGKRLRHGI